MVGFFWCAGTQTGRQTDRKARRQADRLVDIRSNRQTSGRQIERQAETGRQADVFSNEVLKEFISITD